MKISEYIKNWRLRKNIKKRCATLKNFQHTDEDILPENAVQELDALLEAGRKLAAQPEKNACSQWMESAENTLKKYSPHSSMREILDILAVALMVAFGIRALFFQPFKIPTSSMQPTLYGIHYINTAKARSSDGVLPWFGKLGKLGNYLAFSIREAKVDLKTQIAAIGSEIYPVKELAIFDSTLIPLSNGSQVVLPGAPGKVAEYADLAPGVVWRGKVLDGFLSDGDHLFVNRLSLHLRPPQRGDVMVFATENIVGPGGERPSDSGGYYIKRLVGLPLDTLKIVDQVLMVKPHGAEKFVPVYELAPNMKKLYSGLGGYQGHCTQIPGLTHFLRSSNEEYTVPQDHYFMLGDNTRFSADSRVWGPVPRQNLIGRPAVIFWPLSRRWGRIDKAAPLQVPTGQPGIRTFKSMYLQ